MVGDLEMPQPPAGARVERDDRFAEQVRALSLAAPVVITRRSDRDVDDAAGRVGGERRPGIGVADVLPRVLEPGLVAEFAGFGNGLEAPDALAGVHVERLD